MNNKSNELITQLKSELDILNTTIENYLEGNGDKKIELLQALAEVRITSSDLNMFLNQAYGLDDSVVNTFINYQLQINSIKKVVEDNEK